MSLLRFAKLWVMAPVWLLLLNPVSAFACATCFGKSDSALAKGMNWGIFTLLLVVVAMWIGVASFFIYLARRASARAAVTVSSSDEFAAPVNR
jgi:heme/copper-type cytochrome/quinol oxidase subunit 2